MGKKSEDREEHTAKGNSLTFNRKQKGDLSVQSSS